MLEQIKLQIGQFFLILNNLYLSRNYSKFVSCAPVHRDSVSTAENSADSVASDSVCGH